MTTSILGEKYIRTKNRNVSYVFCGLRHNLDSIKSKARILVAWVDEAESVSATAWKKLRPTVRENGSEIWVTWNPEKDGSATDKLFRKNPPKSSMIVEMNYSDNPWFPDVLEEERLEDLENLDYAIMRGFGEGAYLENSDKQVLANKYVVQSFEGRPLEEIRAPCCSAPTSVSQKTRARLLGCSFWITTSTSNTRPTAMV
ncbi:phage terminase [Klebsiella pneumoniae]|uniref:Phage terminase n=1 Tax=Klebsiella pneumoniae TaxID=573 RepID=A0A2X3CAV6_KLEPN|nr:phage terminase [Klebsiella pneumoniae]